MHNGQKYILKTNRFGITPLLVLSSQIKTCHTVLLYGFGIANPWAARIKVWGNCDKQMSPVKMSRESHSLGILFFSFTTEIRMLWSFWLFEAAPVKTEVVQPSKFLFVNLRKATLHQFVCVFISLILPDTFCSLGSHPVLFQGLDSDQIGAVWHNRKFSCILEYMWSFLAANKEADRWQILDGIWTKLPVDWQPLYVYFWWNDLSMCKGSRCFLIKLYFHMRNF